MAQLIVTTSHDYRPDTLVDITEIIFDITGPTLATFGSSQFGGTGISNNVAITGDGSGSFIHVILDAPGTFSAAGWGFANWSTPGAGITFTGTTGIDDITGSSQGDALFGGDAADTLNGGNGNDSITGDAGADDIDGGSGDDSITGGPSDIVLGEMIDGGADFDTLGLVGGTYDFTGVGVFNLERVNFNGDGTITSNGRLFSPSAGGFGNMLQQFAGVLGGTQALIISDNDVNLSNIAFLNWGAATQTITINGTGTTGNALFGSQFADTINGNATGFNLISGAGGADTLNGGAAQDTFVYGAASELVAGEVINAGGALDTLSVSAPIFGAFQTYDFSGFSINGIERIDYTWQLKAIFSQAQMAGITEVDGDAMRFQHLAVTGNATDLSGITFTDWGPNFFIGSTDPSHYNDLIEIIGTAGADNLTGSNKDDTFAPGGGADIASGGDGADTFRIAAQSDLVAGEQLAGGIGVDDIWLLTGGGSLDLSAVLLTDMNRVWFRQGGTGTVTGAQVGVGAISAVIGRPGADALVVNGSSVDLSNLTFPDFGDYPWFPGSGLPMPTRNSWEDGLDTITINGTAGADTLVGSERNDTFVAGAGADMLTGGSGDDRFVYAPGGGADTAIGFVAGAGTPDAVDVSAFTGIDTFADVRARATQVGANTMIDFGGGDTLTLQNVQKSSLNADDFIGVAAVPNDFTGDGKADILWRHDNGTANVFAMDGATVLSGANISQQVDNSWAVQEKADFNGDGHADILWRHQNGTSNIFLMNGATVISGANISQQVDNAWAVRGAGDFNGDGNADILWRHANGTSNVYLMDGQTVIAGSNTSLQVDNAWTVQGVGDFNGDSKADILWRHANGTSNVFLMDGATVIGGSNTSLQVDNGWTVRGVGDFNGDSNADILWRHANGTSNVFLMNGATVIGGSNTSLQVDNAWSVADTGDYNGDGKADILWRHQNGTTNVFLMDGATVIGGSNTSVQVDNAWHVV